MSCDISRTRTAITGIWAWRTGTVTSVCILNLGGKVYTVMKRSPWAMEKGRLATLVSCHSDKMPKRNNFRKKRFDSSHISEGCLVL